MVRLPGPEDRLLLVVLASLPDGQPADTGRNDVRYCGPERYEGSRTKAHAFRPPTASE